MSNGTSKEARGYVKITGEGEQRVETWICKCGKKLVAKGEAGKKELHVAYTKQGWRLSHIPGNRKDRVASCGVCSGALAKMEEKKAAKQKAKEAVKTEA